MISAIGSRHGFTLVELVSTALLIGMVAAVAWPALGPLVRSAAVRVEAGHWQRSLGRARTAAIVTGVRQAVPLLRPKSAFVPSDSSAVFFSDGSARPVVLRPAREDGPIDHIAVDDMGRILIASRSRRAP